MAEELTSQWVGPMPAKTFVATFRLIDVETLATIILMRQDGCGGGFLSDWDLAKRINRDLTARQPYRSGTWQFMSIALLTVPGKTNSLQDDVESFFWVVLYHCLRYMAHTINRLDALKDILKVIFDEEHGAPGQPVRGGNGKRALGLSRTPLGFDWTITGNDPLNTFVDDLLNILKQWHRHFDDHNHEFGVAKRRYGLEEAVKRCPFDDSNLIMRNHDGIISAFEDGLALKTWPDHDAAHDNYGKQRGRPLEDVAEHPKED